MKTTIEKQPLLTSAFEALLNNLGPQKAVQVWQVLATSQGSYTEIRQELFAGKDTTALFEEAEKFNKSK